MSPRFMTFSTKEERQDTITPCCLCSADGQQVEIAMLAEKGAVQHAKNDTVNAIQVHHHS